MGETALWRAVIEQAILDAAKIHKCTARTRSRERLARYAALDWLENGGEDFGVVCNFAGLDLNAVRERAVGAVEFSKLKRWRWRKRAFNS